MTRGEYVVNNCKNPREQLRPREGSRSAIIVDPRGWRKLGLSDAAVRKIAGIMYRDWPRRHQPRSGV